MANDKNNYEMVDNSQINKSSKKWVMWTVSGIVVIGLGIGVYTATNSNNKTSKTAAVQTTETKSRNTSSQKPQKTGTETQTHNSTTIGNTVPQPTTQGGTTVTSSIQSVNEAAHFDYNSTVLSQSLKEQIVILLKQITANNTLTLIGHTDSTGQDSYNFNLGKLRAETVANFIKEKNSNIQVTVLSKGEGSPIADNSTEAGQAQNRRVEFVLSSK